MGGIFISYRREDSGLYAGRLRDALNHHFGAEQVFRDIDRIGPGDRFPGVIEKAVGSCDALLALIGPEWLEVQDGEGRRRLDNPDDYVGHEIASALRRPDVLVIPVLLGHTPMPEAEDLPKPLAGLAECNAARITDESWDDQVVRLTTALDKVVQRTDVPKPPKVPGRKRLGRRSQIVLGAVAVVAVVAALVTYLVWPPQASPPQSRQIVLLEDLLHPHGVAVDSAGALIITDHDHGLVLKLAAGAKQPEILPFPPTLTWPSGVAVDRFDTIYVVDSFNNQVLKLAADSSDAEPLPFTGPFALKGPRGVAVDLGGAVYVGDLGNSRVLKLSAGSTNPTTLHFTDLNGPAGVAVDNAGNVFVTDENAIRVWKLDAGGREAQLHFNGISRPHGVAVDSLDNVYVTDDDKVLKLAAGSDTAATLPFDGLDNPGGVAVDDRGNVYVVDWGKGSVLKLPPG